MISGIDAVFNVCAGCTTTYFKAISASWSRITVAKELLQDLYLKVSERRETVDADMKKRKSSLNCTHARKQSLVNKTMVKKTLLFLLVTFSLIFFHEKLYDLFDQYIVANFLEGLRGDWLYWPVCALTITAIIQLIAMLRDRSKVNDVAFFGCILFLCCYLYQRISGDHYSFYRSTFAPAVAYLDSLLIPAAGLGFLGFRERLRVHGKPIMKNSPFTVDAPILRSDADVFDRDRYARLMAEKIQSNPIEEFSGSLAIGVLGKWGSGKTSFLNLVKEKIDGEGRILIDFNPWGSSSPSMIIENFFEVLTKELSEYDRSLSRDMSRYASTLTEMDDNWISKSIKSGSDFFMGSSTVGVDYDEINRALVKVDKQIIVFIDDLDRLDSREIMEVLRIIRNTGNFKNVVYVVAYDRNYVVTSLKELNSHQSQHYLEKIFQFEFKLPDAAVLELRRNIRNGLKAALTNTSLHDAIDAAIDYTGESGECITDKVILTQREVVRLINSMLFELDGQIEEVNLTDFYLLQLLKLRYSKVYDDISLNRQIFFFEEDQRLRLRAVDEIGKQKNSLASQVWKLMGDAKPKTGPEEKKISVLEHYLTSLGTDFADENGKRTIKEIVYALLVDKELRTDSTSMDYKSFINYVNFEKYFMSYGRENKLSFAAFEAARKGSPSEYLEAVLKWAEDPDLSAELERRLSTLVDFTSKEEWEKHLMVTVALERKKMVTRGAFGANYSAVIDLLKYPKSFDNVHLFVSDAAYFAYINDFFIQAESPYIYEAHLLMAILVRNEDLGLSETQICDQLFDYFKKYCNSHDRITMEFRNLHTAIVEKDKHHYGQFPVQERAEVLFKEYFRKYITACELGGFIKRYFDPEKKYYMFDIEWIAKVFGSKDELIAYAVTAENIDHATECYREFSEFSNKVAASAHPAIEYSFNHLKKEE
ncbi:KAP family P-loop NTPase fold protein [Pedobacter sp. GSP4]|uniref:KAP family P-loop NTPase fold protein n=1 Tax=Pedobacter sp. GSP4 TaxID=3453716 RepID=UPI003EF058D2